MAERTSLPRAAYLAPPSGKKEAPPIARWTWIVAAIFAVMLCAAGIWGFSEYRTQHRDAAAIIDALHVQMRANDSAGIFAASDPAYQRDVGRAKSDELFTFVRERLGAPQTSTLTGWHVESTTKSGELKTLNFDTQFAKGAGTEMLVLRKRDGKYLLLRYVVDSKLIKDSDVPADLRN